MPARLGRPFHPELGLNRELLLALRREPGQSPGTLARVLRRDGAVVRDAVARLEDNGLVTVEAAERGRACYPTEAGLAVLRKRRRSRPQAVHKAVVTGG